MIQRRFAMLAIALPLAFPAWGAGAADFPHKPIKVVVPFPPGGGGDNQARLVLTRAAKELGQPIIFENIAGAGGNVGAQQVARAAADGYTLLYGTNGTHGINHALYKNPGFNPLKDFAPVSRLTSIPALLVTRPDAPMRNVGELIARMKQKPGATTFASAGNGTTSHLAGEMLKSTAQVDAVHVPYKGGAAALVDLLAGRVDFMIDVMPNTAPQVRGGRLKALAVSSAERNAGFPDVPTMVEAGVPGFRVTAWDALFAPAGTPRAAVDKLNAAVNKALADPQLREQLASRGSEAVASTPEELGRFVASEMERWGAAVKRSGAAVD